MNRQVFDPIHLPCPDMAGCANPDPELTKNSIEWVRKLRAQLIAKMPKKSASHIPARFRVASIGSKKIRKQDEAPEMGADSSTGGAV